jgi:hypothetical protein
MLYFRGESMNIAKWTFLLSLLGATAAVTLFQNCSKSKSYSVSTLHSSLLSRENVHGTNTLVTPHSTNNQMIVGVDEQGVPQIDLPDSEEKNDSAPTDQIVCDTDPVQPDECDSSRVFVNGKCIDRCSPGQIFVDDKCLAREQDCPIIGGKGKQFWASNSYGKCVPQSCEQGFKLVGETCAQICSNDETFYDGKCIPKVKTCRFDNGFGSQLWEETQYGACTFSGCLDGFKLVANKCVSVCASTQEYFQGKCYDKVQKCDVAGGGTGNRTWNGKKYGDCKAVSCPAGLRVADEKCVSVCSAGQVFVNGKCNPDVVSCNVVNGAGLQKWDAGAKKYGVCDPVKCDKGFKEVNNICVSECATSQVYLNGTCVDKVDKCEAKNGYGLKTLDAKNVYGACVAVSCKDGYHIEAKECVITCKPTEVGVGDLCLPKVKDCPIVGGAGQQTWDDKTYGRCVVVSCDRGRVRSGNACVVPPPPRPPESRGGGGGGGGRSGDPLIVDMADRPEKINLSSQLQGIMYNLLGSFKTPVPNEKVLISWTRNPRYRYLALPNAEGQILGVDQLFGDNTVGPDGLGAKDGFAALVKYDGKDVTGKIKISEPDMMIDEKDAIFEKLVLWFDMNGDGVSSPNEYNSLRSMGVESISLNYDGNFHETDKWGNSIIFKSVVKFKDGRESLIFDLWFRYYEKVREGCYKK